MPSWSIDGAEKNSAAQTSITAKCGWSLTPETLTPTRSVKIDATFPMDLPSENPSQALEEWLRHTAETTEDALMDPEVVSTAYPAQRLLGVHLSGPGHVTSGEVIPLTLVGEWPAGINEISPLFVFPPKGSLTSPLEAVLAGKADNLRIIDRCQGAVSVSDDGKSVTALFPTSACDLLGTVGNYDIPPLTISISGKGS